MSSLKTEHYGLHKWEPGDDFIRSEFNENFELVDGAIHTAEVVTGTYTGTGAGNTQTIDLGFRPRAVLALPKDYNFASRGIIVALSVEGAECAYLPLTDSGFAVRGALNSQEDGDTGAYYPRNPFRYLAWR